MRGSATTKARQLILDFVIISQENYKRDLLDEEKIEYRICFFPQHSVSNSILIDIW